MNQTAKLSVMGLTHEEDRINEHQALKKLILLSAMVSFFMFLPFLIADGGRFSLIADFNVQQIPFNMHTNKLLRSGQLGWDWTTDLGVDWIGAYGFYTLGSPFFWLSALFPPKAFPYLIGWIYMLKYITASLAAFLWLKRQVRNPDYAVIGALLYAFSGFSHINLQFYHFHEVLAFFPLLLVGLDRLVLDRKKGIFALATALCALTNYFFFFGEVLFLILYFFLVYRFDSGKARTQAFFQVLAEGIIGALIAGVLLVPCALFILQSPKTSALLDPGFMLIFQQPQRYYSILKALLFPAESMVNPSGPFVYDYSSSALYLPALGISMVFAGWKESRYKRLILTCLVIAFIPVFNAAFTLLNGLYYARWFYMPLLILTAMSVAALETASPKRRSRALRLTAGLTVGLPVMGFILTKADIMGVNLPFTALSAAIALAGLLAAALIFRRWPRNFVGPVLLLVSIFALGTGIFSLSLTRLHDPAETRAFAQGYLWDTARLPLIPQAGSKKNYRFYTHEPAWNLSLLNEIPSVNSFITTNSPSTYEFFSAVGIRHIPTSLFPEKVDDILTFLSVRYRLDSEAYPGYTLLYQADNGQSVIHVSENPDFLPMGYPLDYWIYRSQLDTYPQETRARILLQAMVLPDGSTPPVHLKAYDRAAFARTAREIVQAKDGRTVTDFDRSASGFSGRIKASTDTTLLFSVPADQGWRATLNGEAIPISPSLGFLTIRIPPGDHGFQFHYSTPGLKIGGILSCLGLGLLLWRSWQPRKIQLS